MTRALNHDDAFAALDAAALDTLEGQERDAVYAHVNGCAICQTELSNLRATFGALALAAPEVDATVCRREPIRERLMARMSADTHGGRNRRKAKERRLPVEWLAAAAIVLFVASAAVLVVGWRYTQGLHDAMVGQAVASANVQDSLSHALAQRDSMLAGLVGRDVAMVTLTSNGAHAPVARMFWDKQRNMWTFIAHDMPVLPAGRTYQLWLVTASAKISAGTFAPVRGEAMVRATYALPSGELKAVAVTEEPAGGMPQPTGQMVIAGTAQ